jgi:hypothetical protein
MKFPKRIIKRIALSISILSILLIVLFVTLFGLYIPYKYRINKDNPDYYLENIDATNHKTQSKDMIYSIDVQKLKNLVNLSDSTYQLVYFYNVTCPSIVKLTSILKDSLFILENTEVFPICVADRTLLPLLQEQIDAPNVKKYVIDSEKYYSYSFDMYEHNNNSKTNFLNEMQPNAFFEGSYAILFEKWENIEFVHDENYYKKYWKEGMSNSESDKLFINNLVSDIKNIANKLD